MLFDVLRAKGHEEVHVFTDRPTGLKTVIAIHSTKLGPALGGTRFYDYPTEEAAFDDVLRLSEGMSYKAAMARLPLGGGKAIIIGDPSTKTPELLRAYARRVDLLQGRYITAEDMNITSSDVDVMAEVTDHVVGTSGGAGDPGKWTALGVLESMRAAMATLGVPLGEVSVLVSGLGSVGMALSALLVAEGATVYGTDIREAAVEKAAADVGVIPLPLGSAIHQPVDIYSPCAIGAILNESTIPQLNCRAVVGSANNQLASEADAIRLSLRGILYVPDFIANAGGLIDVVDELDGDIDPERVRRRVEGIGDTVAELLERSTRDGILPQAMAIHIAQERVASGIIPAPR
jgi:glutamate dehydrogenase/leucine dehydrogenase